MKVNRITQRWFVNNFVVILITLIIIEIFVSLKPSATSTFFLNKLSIIEILIKYKIFFMYIFHNSNQNMLCLIYSSYYFISFNKSFKITLLSILLIAKHFFPKSLKLLPQ